MTASPPGRFPDAAINEMPPCRGEPVPPARVCGRCAATVTTEGREGRWPVILQSPSSKNNNILEHQIIDQDNKVAENLIWQLAGQPTPLPPLRRDRAGRRPAQTRVGGAASQPLWRPILGPCAATAPPSPGLSR